MTYKYDVGFMRRFGSVFTYLLFSQAAWRACCGYFGV